MQLMFASYFLDKNQLNLDLSLLSVFMTNAYHGLRWNVSEYIGEIKGLAVTKGRRQNSLPLTTKLSQNVTEPLKGISQPVGNLCQCFTKLTEPCAYTLHSNLILPTDRTNGLV